MKTYDRRPNTGLTLKLSILMTGQAYLPEAYAYQQYLTERGWEVKLCNPGQYDFDADYVLSFQGDRLPDMKKYRCKVVHEYHSLATGSFPRLRQFAKRLIAARPNGRSFLNSMVRERAGFKDDVPWMDRDMGVDDGFYDRDPGPKEFDLVYCGSIRAGMADCFEDLSNKGYTLLIVGRTTDEFTARFAANPNVTMVGAVDRSQIPFQVRRARYGLDYTPDEYPHTIQTRTKNLEYLAAGLGLVANHYEWVDRFCAEHPVPVVWLEDLLADKARLDEEIPDVDMNAFRWSRILDDAGFEEFLLSLR